MSGLRCTLQSEVDAGFVGGRPVGTADYVWLTKPQRHPSGTLGKLSRRYPWASIVRWVEHCNGKKESGVCGFRSL